MDVMRISAMTVLSRMRRRVADRPEASGHNPAVTFATTLAVAFLFGEGCADESSCSGSTIRSPVDFVWDAMRGERTGGPEPHAARDGWIAIRRSGHTSEHCSRSAPAGWSQEFRSTASSVCNPSSYPRSQAYTCLAKALADLHQHPAPTAGKHNPWKIALGVNMGYEMSQA